MGVTEPPEWFDPFRYAEAEELDAGDWLFNLTVRCWLHHKINDMVEDYMRHRHTVLRRDTDSEVLSKVFAISDTPASVLEAFEHGRVRSGINALTVQDLYVFERRLPEELRKAGASFEPGRDLPEAFRGKLDDAFGKDTDDRPLQMTSRFARLDVTLPDDVLFADIKKYLTAERARLATFGGPMEWREAARIKAHSHDLGTLSTIRLLPFLDLDRWQRRKGLGWSFEKLRNAAGCDKGRSRDLRKYADWSRRQMLLHAWFARLDRSATLEEKKRETKSKELSSESS